MWSPSLLVDCAALVTGEVTQPGTGGRGVEVWGDREPKGDPFISMPLTRGL